jgi:hypothetical protein
MTKGGCRGGAEKLAAAGVPEDLAWRYWAPGARLAEIAAASSAGCMTGSSRRYIRSDIPDV